MGYGHGIIPRQPKQNLQKGVREYNGACLNGCGAQIHTVGNPPRKFCVDCIAKRAESSQLAEGLRCGECRSFERCSWLISCSPDSRTCDWAPSRFELKVSAPADQGEVEPPAEAMR